MRKVFIKVFIIVSVLFAGYLLVDFITKAMPAIDGYFEAGGDHDEIRNRKIPYSRPLFEASRLLPPGASVGFPGAQLRTIDHIAMRYAVYPARVKEPWNYALDVAGKPDAAFSSWISHALSGGAVLYVRPGYQLLNPSPPAPRNRGVERAFFFILSLTITLIGVQYLRALGIGPSVLGIAWFLATGYLCGFIIIHAMGWAVLLTGGILDSWTLAMVIVISAASARILKGCLRLQEIRMVVHAKEKDSFKRWRMFSHGSALFVLMMVVLTTIVIPITVWDEMFIWIMRARMMFFDGKIDFSYFPATNVYYPILWPLHVHLFFKAAGGCFSELLKWVSAAVFLVFIAQLRAVCVFLKIDRSWILAVIVVYLLVFMNFIFFTALPENIFSALSLATVAGLLLWLREGRRRYLALAIFMALGLSGVKFEGAILAGALAVCAALAGRVGGKSFRQLAPLLWFIIPCAVPKLWTAWLTAHDHSFSIYHFGNPLVLDNVLAVGEVIGHSLLKWRNLLIIGLTAAGYALFVRGRPWNHFQVFLWLAFLAFTGFSVVSVLFWPTNDIQLYYPEVLDRLFLRATPFLALFLASRAIASAKK